MARSRSYEDTLPGNPRRLTIDQHIHSKSCIKRFADASNRVGVLERGKDRVVRDGPASARFCAKRGWDQRLEHGKLFRTIEAAFRAEAVSIIANGTVSNHRAITEYISIWQLRANVADNPPTAVELKGVASALTKEEEEILESRGGMFMRGSSVPARFVASFEMLPRHEQNLGRLRGVHWGVVTPLGASRFICPDQPACQLYVPLTPALALIAGYRDVRIPDAAVDQLNRDAYTECRRFVFGHPRDVEAFRRLVRSDALQP